MGLCYCLACLGWEYKKIAEKLSWLGRYALAIGVIVGSASIGRIGTDFGSGMDHMEPAK